MWGRVPWTIHVTRSPGRWSSWFPVTGDLNTRTLKENPQVGHPSVIDVGVGFFQPPFFRVQAEVPLHILVDLLLQVDSGLAVSPDYNITADTDIIRHIAARIGDFPVAPVIDDPVLRPLQGRFHPPGRNLLVVGIPFRQSHAYGKYGSAQDHKQNKDQVGTGSHLSRKRKIFQEKKVILWLLDSGFSILFSDPINIASDR